MGLTGIEPVTFTVLKRLCEGDVIHSTKAESSKGIALLV